MKHLSAMKYRLCGAIGFCGFFNAVKAAKMDSLSIKANQGPPSIPDLANTKNPARTVLVRALSVVRICAFINVAKVRNPIVRSDAVDVVNHKARPLAVHVQPSKSVRSLQSAINLNTNVSVCSGAGHCASPSATSSVRPPSKDAGRLVVVKKFAQTLRGKIGLSHEAVLSLIGQRPAGVSSTAAGLAIFAQQTCVI